MKYYYLVSIFLFISISTYALEPSLEWEILNIGLPFGIQTDKKGDVVRSYDKGFALGTEVRYNYMDKKLSSGIQVSFTGWNRRSPKNDDYFTNHQNPFQFLFVTDYNFRDLNINPNKVLPFAGIGIGCSLLRSRPLEDLGDPSNVKSHFACSPRVGVEFFKRMRLTAEYQYIGKENSFFNIKLGFVVGS